MAKRATGARHLVVIVNNDHQASLKKGHAFMPLEERMKIISELRCVNTVVASIDRDRTVCETIQTLDPVPDYFCNGGDQQNHNIPEAMVCHELGIELVDKLGDKIQSSSWLLKGTRQKSFWKTLWEAIEEFLHSGHLV